MTKKRVVVICPGRGSYTRETSNYLSDLSSEVSNHLKDIDNKRVAKNLPKISALDKENFRMKTHMLLFALEEVPIQEKHLIILVIYHLRSVIILKILITKELQKISPKYQP